MGKQIDLLDISFMDDLITIFMCMRMGVLNWLIYINRWAAKAHRVRESHAIGITV